MRNIILNVINVVLIISGILFLLLSIFTDINDSLFLPLALVTTFFGNVASLINQVLTKRENEKK